MSRDRCFLFWCDALVESGFEGLAGTREELADFLIMNEFTAVRQLQFADHPREWGGADQFSEEELEAVWKLRNYKGKRCRCASTLHMCVQVV